MRVMLQNKRPDKNIVTFVRANILIRFTNAHIARKSSAVDRMNARIPMRLVV